VRDAGACEPCRPSWIPHPAGPVAIYGPAHQRHAQHSHQAARCWSSALEGENGLRYVVFTER
jgi:hypothetical protein